MTRPVEGTTRLHNPVQSSTVHTTNIKKSRWPRSRFPSFQICLWVHKKDGVLSQYVWLASLFSTLVSRFETRVSSGQRTEFGCREVFRWEDIWVEPENFSHMIQHRREGGATCNMSLSSNKYTSALNTVWTYTEVFNLLLMLQSSLCTTEGLQYVSS